MKKDNRLRFLIAVFFWVSIPEKPLGNKYKTKNPNIAVEVCDVGLNRRHKDFQSRCSNPVNNPPSKY